MKSLLSRWLIVAVLFLVSTACQNAVAETLRVGVQKTGTFAWQLDVIARHGLARERGLDFTIQEFASPEAGKIALNGGTVDVAVVDWLWVARQRALGRALKYYPFSTAVGAVMVKGDSPLRELSDLKGRSLAVAGGALDKSWLRHRSTGTAPTVLSPDEGMQKLDQGKADVAFVWGPVHKPHLAPNTHPSKCVRGTDPSDPVTSA